MRKNYHGRFLLCSVTDLDGKRHRLLFPEGNGLTNGWTMLEEALQEMGYKEDRGDRRKLTKTSSIDKVENQKGELSPGTNTDIMNPRRRRHETIWLDTSECCPKGDLGLLKYGVVGSWKALPVTAQSLLEVEAWAMRVWKLKGRIAIHPLNHNMFFMGFELSEEARWVMENGSKICRGRVMQLEWWTPYSGCKGLRDQENEVWIRVVGLPLHLWTGEILKKVGDNCGGFIALDEDTASKTDLHWARILVKMKSNVKPALVNLLAGARSYKLRIWWEIRPMVAEVFPRSSRTYGSPADPGEEDDRIARANGRVKTAQVEKRHNHRDGQSKVGSQSILGSCATDNRLSNSQSRGMRANVGTKKGFEVQNVLGIKGRKGKPNYALMMGSAKEKYGPHLEGDEVQISGQTQGVFVGPCHASIGEQSPSPTERYYPTNLRAESKGRTEEKIGMVNPSCSGPQESEVSEAEEKGSQETTSTQGQGCSEKNNIKKALRKEESSALKDEEGSKAREEGRNYCTSEKESPSGKCPEKNSFCRKPGLCRCKRRLSTRSCRLVRQRP